MARTSRCFSASFAFLILWICLPHADAQTAPQLNPVPEKAFIDETSRDGHVSVEVTQGRDGRRETLIIRSGQSIYRVSDERLLGYNDDDSSYDHDFYLSPNAKWLFVSRKLFHTVDIGYLYHLEGKQFERVRPQGLRFDEAAIRYFSHHLHFPYDAIGEGSRIIRFGQWTAGGKQLVFQFTSSEHYQSKKCWLVEGVYNLKSGRFGLVHLETEVK